MKSEPFVLRTDFNNQIIIGRTKHFMHTYILPSELEEVIESLDDIRHDLLVAEFGRQDSSLTDEELEKYYL